MLLQCHLEFDICGDGYRARMLQSVPIKLNRTPVHSDDYSTLHIWSKIILIVFFTISVSSWFTSATI